MYLKRLFLSAATENNKAFLEKLWKLPPKKKSLLTKLWPLLTIGEIILLYLCKFHHVPEWVGTVLLIYMWMLNLVLTSLLSYIMSKSYYIQSISEEHARMYFANDVDQRIRVGYVFDLSTLFDICLTMALIASGWYFTAAVIVYSYVKNRDSSAKLVAAMYNWVQIDFVKEEGSNGTTQM